MEKAKENKKQPEKDQSSTRYNNEKRDKSDPGPLGNEEQDGEEIYDDTGEGALTEEDREALGPIDLSMNGGDDELLKHRVHPVDFSGSDLDVPGSENDDASEEIGSEDEENNSYSLSDNNDDKTD
ncbi:MAG: hypothetical protein AB1458_11345 [Bacteroidota bacterium]